MLIFYNKHHKGPSTIETSDGTTILVGVASYVFMKCGPGTWDGVGTSIYDSANYVDIYHYMDWIKDTMNNMGDNREG